MNILNSKNTIELQFSTTKFSHKLKLPLRDSLTHEFMDGFLRFWIEIKDFGLLSLFMCRFFVCWFEGWIIYKELIKPELEFF